MSEFKLCYVKEPFAYFTTAELKDQDGEGWQKHAYEYNAEEPYLGCGADIIQIAYTGNLNTPSTHHSNSPFSVDMINSGAIAWLFSEAHRDEQIAIPAGTSIEEFKRLIKKASGKTYEDSDNVVQHATASAVKGAFDTVTVIGAWDIGKTDETITTTKILEGATGGVLTDLDKKKEDDTVKEPMILPCPFCGGKATIQKYRSHKYEKFIFCGICKSGGAVSSCDASAIKKWNRRVKHKNQSITTTKILEGATGGEIKGLSDLDIKKGGRGRVLPDGTHQYFTSEQNDYEGRN